MNAWPIWLPLMLLNLAWGNWLDYIRRHWIKSQGATLLEIRLPKEVFKSPAAMELVLHGIFEPAAPGTMSDAFWEGKLRDWFSLEIVSLGGQVRFFIWTLPKWKSIIESRIYAQYPEAEVFEVKDYALDINFDSEKQNLFALNTALVKPDAYPIKTYIDYELDKKKGDEQEEIVDPLTPLIEYLGTLKPDEMACIQILIQAHRKEGLLDGRLFVKPDWSGGHKEEIQKIIKEKSFVKISDDKPQTLQHLTRTQTDVISAIERNAGKLAFDTMIRLFYIAPTQSFDRTRGMGIIGSMRQFGSANLNGIKPTFLNTIAYPWQDFRDVKKKRNQREFVDAFKRRSFFNVPYKHLFGKPYVLTVEELATVFHLPGSVATTPTLARAPSKKGEAPANLPI